MASDDTEIDTSHRQETLSRWLAGARERLSDASVAYEREVQRLMDEIDWLHQEVSALEYHCAHERSTWTPVLASPSGSLSPDAIAFLDSTRQAYEYEIHRRIETILESSYLVMEHKSDLFDAIAPVLDTLDHKSSQTANESDQSRIRGLVERLGSDKQTVNRDPPRRSFGHLRGLEDLFETVPPTLKQKGDSGVFRWKATSDRLEAAVDRAYAVVRSFSQKSDDPSPGHETLEPSLEKLTLEDAGVGEAVGTEEGGSDEQD